MIRSGIGAECLGEFCRALFDSPSKGWIYVVPAVND